MIEQNFDSVGTLAMLEANFLNLYPPWFQKLFKPH